MPFLEITLSRLSNGKWIARGGGKSRYDADRDRALQRLALELAPGEHWRFVHHPSLDPDAAYPVTFYHSPGGAV